MDYESDDSSQKSGSGDERGGKKPRLESIENDAKDLDKPEVAIKVAGSATTKKLLGARYAAHAIFAKQAKLKEVIDEKSTSGVDSTYEYSAHHTIDDRVAYSTDNYSNGLNTRSEIEQQNDISSFGSHTMKEYQNTDLDDDADMDESNSSSRNSKVISIKASDLHGQWVPQPMMQSNESATKHLHLKSWDSTHGVVKDVKEISRVAKRRNQLGALASSAVSKLKNNN